MQDEQRHARAVHDPNWARYEFVTNPTDAPRGFFLLPDPSPGDVFFDMEGDPFYEIGRGLEYLFGAYTADDDTFRPFWGCDRSERPVGADRLAEKRAFEAFIDFVMERRKAFPTMHVYHYASYEKTALQKLSQWHATREDEVDVILREEILVDLYRVVRQALVVGQPSYSIKKIEEYYGKRGDASGVKGGDESILRFEEWRALRSDPARRDDAILDDLEVYNKYDCISTHGLREWLLELRAQGRGVLRLSDPAVSREGRRAGESADRRKVRRPRARARRAHPRGLRFRRPTIRDTPACGRCSWRGTCWSTIGARTSRSGGASTTAPRSTSKTRSGCSTIRRSSSAWS